MKLFAIGISVQRPQLLGLLLLIPLVYLAWLRWPPPLTPRRSVASLGLRTVLIALLVAAVAGIQTTAPSRSRAVIAVVDLSASTLNVRQSQAQLVRALASSRGPDDLFGVVTFGRDALVDVAPTKRPVFETFRTQSDPNYTDISSALQLAAGIVPSGFAKQLVLLTDGRENVNRATAEALALRKEGVRIDVLDVGASSPPESMVLSTEAPPAIRVGESASVAVRTQANVQSTAQLTLRIDGSQTDRRQFDLPTGLSTQIFALPNLQPGLHVIQADLAASPDTYTQNDVGEAVIRVIGPPSILLLEGFPGEGTNVQHALAASGMHVDRLLASRTAPSAADLARYDSIVIVDAPASAFPANSMKAIETFVRTLGRGLVAIGGPSSYGPGSWQNTPLEDALPVLMNPPTPKVSVAVVLVMESMESAIGDRISRGAAQSVLEQLTASDEFGVTDGLNGFAINLQKVTDKSGLANKLAAAQFGDPPSYTQFIEMAGAALRGSTAPIKHIIVIGDGDAQLVDVMSGQTSDTLHRQIRSLASLGITTSAIGVNTHNSVSNTAFMQDLARVGGGRFYAAANASEVPQLLLTESRSALRPWLEQSQFVPVVASGGDLLHGVAIASMPQLNGYVATSIKPGAEAYLASPKQDPILAAWNYGLGRSVAWTSDSDGYWTGEFLQSPVSAELFASMVNWTLPTSSSSKLSITSDLSSDGIDITVNSSEPGSLQLTDVTPQLASNALALNSLAPTQWSAHIPTDTTGTYLLHAVLSSNSGTMQQADSAVVVPYLAEYVAFGPDVAFLAGLAQVGGAILTRPAEAWSEPVTPVLVARDVYWALLIVAAVLWPFDIALRRFRTRPDLLVSFAGTLFSSRLGLKAQATVSRGSPRAIPRRRASSEKGTRRRSVRPSR